MINAPCLDCTERHLGCHGTCKGYKDYQEEKRKESRFMKGIREGQNDLRNYKEEKYRRLKQ